MNDDKTPRDLLDWLGITDAPRWAVARPLGPLFAMVLAVLLVLALVAAFAVLGHTLLLARSGAREGINLGAGALIVALLGAPFLIWSTVLKHQTLRYQKEGHITDRINKAVEQLGATKTIERIGRSVTISLGHPDYAEPDEPSRGETVIEWKGMPLQLNERQWVSTTADWQVFKETVPNIEVRIGAILSLERIAQDSTRYDKGHDHVRVMEILCAYVRQNAPTDEAKDHEFGAWEPLKRNPTPEDRAAHLKKREARFGAFSFDGQVASWARGLREPRADIAIALRVIGRRSPAQRLAEARWGKDARAEDLWVFATPCPNIPDETNAEGRAAFAVGLAAWRRIIRSYRGYRLDLRSTNLQRADLSDLDLSGARLHGARMEGANIRGAQMVGADLTGARMEGANLSRARMQGASLVGARMEGASLIQAVMKGANLGQAWMQGAMLGNAQMEGAILDEARAEWASLRDARMEGADLSSARMEGADLHGARMEGADLSDARMAGSELAGAQFDSSTRWTGLFGEVMLHGAAVQRVDFKDTSITPDQVAQTFGDGSTRLPDTIPRPAHWPKAELDWRAFDSELQKWRADPQGYKPPD